ncbi:GNL3L/Grn1 putative GTPase-domain-containing protein, partial [Cokeromyces recurvatus]|uniref:GNL3L/Grn1 putative GTPase-domain-containing protein n=1 Tax=Cokeromyces recurvatus TaxID=90255 RepID=UPI002220BFE2
ERQSKRIRLAHKYRIAGRIKDAHRKERRAAKKNPSTHHKAKKDPGIPNEWPFKEELLNEIQAQKLQAEEEKLKNKQKTQVEKAKAKKAARKAEIAANIAAAKAAKAAAQAAISASDEKKASKKKSKD